MSGLVFLDMESALDYEVRGWLTANLPTYLRDKVTLHQEIGWAEYVHKNKVLAAKSCSVPHRPIAWGGTGCRDAIREMLEALGKQLRSLILAMVRSSNSCCKLKSTITQ